MQSNVKESQAFEMLKKKQQRSMWGSVFFVLICLGLGLTTIYFGYKAETQKKEIDKQKELSEIDAFLKDSLIKELKTDSISSEQTKQAYISKLDSFKLAFHRIDSLLKLSEMTPIQREIIKEIEDVEKRPKYTIYLHTYGDRASDVMNKFNTQLLNNGFTAQGIEGIKTPFTSRVSYFHGEDASLANRITKLLKSSIENETIASLTPVLSKMSAPKGQIEIWLNLEPKIDKDQYIKDRVIKDIYFRGQTSRLPN